MGNRWRHSGFGFSIGLTSCVLSVGARAEPLTPNATTDVTAPSATVRLHLESTAPGITFHREVHAASAGGGTPRALGYSRLCTSPCDLSLPAGSERFALSVADRGPVAAGSVTLPAGRARLIGSYESHQGERMAGGVLIGVGAVALTATLVVAAVSTITSSCSDGPGGCSRGGGHTSVLLGGAVVGAVGLGLGFALLFVPDEASLSVQSLAGPAKPPEPSARSRVPGLAVRASF